MSGDGGTARIVIAGASGFVGRRLVDAYRSAGASVHTIGRSGDAVWGDTAAIAALLDGADMLINLAGKNVSCRYTEANRAEILRSRVETTGQLRAVIAALPSPPPVWFNASTATIYRHATDHSQSESGGDLGDGFSVGIARAWEREFFAGELPGTRRVALRMAIVLGDGSALAPLIGLSRVGLGGAQLDGRWPLMRARIAAGTAHRYDPEARGGRQRMSWIHLDDVLGAVEFIRAHPEIAGPVNLAAPGVSTSAEFMATLRTVLRVPLGIPVFRWMTELGAIALRTESEMVLKSRWVVPETLTDAGFEFRYPVLEPALRQIVATRSGIAAPA